MSQCVNSNCGFLNKVNKKLSKAKRQKIINEADSQSINAICEIIHNFLRGIIPIPSSNLEKLKKYKRSIRQLGNNSFNKKLKRSILIQHGGFLPLILSPLLTLVAGAAGKYIGNKLSR
jgi:hypothetical protein